jgi:hypothetical protein
MTTILKAKIILTIMWASLGTVKAIYYISAVVTQGIKSVALLQLVIFGYMFRALPAIIRPTSNSIVKVHSTSFSSGIRLFMFVKENVGVAF